MGGEALIKFFESAALKSTQGRNPLLDMLATQFGQKKKPKQPGRAGGGGTGSGTGAKSKTQPQSGDFLEDFFTALADRGGGGRASIPEAVVAPIPNAPAPPRGDPNVQRLLEEIILELGGMNQRR